MPVEFEPFFDVTSRRCVTSLTDASDFVLPTFFHQDSISFVAHFVKRNPQANRNTPYSNYDITSSTLKLRIFDSTGATVLASQDSWTADTAAQTLSATVNLNTVAMAAAFTSAETTRITAILELELDGMTVFQKRDLLIAREYLVAATPAAVENETFLSENQIIAMFVRFVENAAGKSITLKSPDGTKAIVLSCGDDGGFRADPLTT